VPFWYAHGTADEFIPFEGGRGAKSLAPVEFRSVAETMNWWLAANHCSSEPASVSALLPRFNDGTRVTRTVYQPTSTHLGEPVVQWTIHDGGHTWPGGPDKAGSIAGTVTHNLNAAEELWRFFIEHQKEG
jgi:polyhydroxybutyrate depolymerase